MAVFMPVNVFWRLAPRSPSRTYASKAQRNRTPPSSEQKPLSFVEESSSEGPGVHQTTRRDAILVC